jgi:hypothetical protein
MITILHGDDLVASREELNKIRFRYKSVDLVDREFSKLAQVAASQLLWDDQRLILVENFFKEKAKLELSVVTSDVVFWEGETISKTALAQFEGTKGLRIQEFTIPVLIFRFCEAIGVSDKRRVYELFKEVLKTQDVEYVFLMIVRQFRLLLCPDLATGWQKDKIVSQGKKIGLDRLKLIFEKLLLIDYRSKTSGLINGLESEIELLLIWI